MLDLAHIHSYKSTKRSDASYSQESIASFSYVYYFRDQRILLPQLWTTVV